MFIDQAKIKLKAGNGGPGCVSFRREKFLPKGGPDGGDGGKGGDVWFVADESVDTLIDFSGKIHMIAKNGMHGEGCNKSGRDADDLVIRVPVGTLVYDEDLDGLLLVDLNEDGMKARICKAGIGGKGNKFFANSVRQTPRIAQPGTEGVERNVRLELKLIADVGLVGLPNAGKSTLVSRCSAARPKIASYPFTTLEPVLGIVELSGYRRFVISDLPGLIEGAHEGSGLGHDFLRHIERTRIIVHIIDVMPMDESDPFENYEKIRNELICHSAELGRKNEIIVLNKTDLDPDGKATQKIKDKFGDREIYSISAVTGEGTKELSEVLWKLVQIDKGLLEVEEEF